MSVPCFHRLTALRPWSLIIPTLSKNYPKYRHLLNLDSGQRGLQIAGHLHLRPGRQSILQTKLLVAADVGVASATAVT